MPSVDISVPMHLRKIKQPSSNSITEAQEKTLSQELKSFQYLNPKSKNYEIDESLKEENVTTPKKQMFNFVVMSKKNNKPQYHNMNVPLVSSFANQFKAREEVNKVCMKNEIILRFQII